MTKSKNDAPSDEAAAPAVEAPPSRAKIGETPASICSRLRIVDAETGEPIRKVIEADADKGKLIRFAVEDGALVREGDRFKMIEEDRAIRIEWADAGEVSF